MRGTKQSFSTHQRRMSTALIRTWWSAHVLRSSVRTWRIAITARTLNRTTLQRQLLLERAPLDALSAVHQLVGLQAQVPANPYPGLWSRLEGFDAADLGTLLVERQVVRIASIRGTIHLLTADDCLGVLAAVPARLRPGAGRASRGGAGPRRRRSRSGPRVGAGAAGRRSRSPFPPSAQRWAERFPAHDAAALAYACRNHLALVQVPPRGLLGRSHQVTVTTAEAWLGRPLAASPSVDDLVAPLPARVRPGDGGGHRDVVPAHGHRRRPRPPRRAAQAMDG